MQTCRKLIDDGAIGTPVAATAFMLGSGPESWHPNPGIFYAFGAGPMFDMGPYYLTALVSLLGPIRRVTGSARITRAQREIGSEPLKGQMIDVEVPTHIASVLDFHAGPVATLVTSFDVWAHETPRIEIYGTEGTLSVPDPNTFGGPVKLRKAGEESWTEVPLTHGYDNNSRGVGLADLAVAIKSGRPQRASGDSGVPRPRRDGVGPRRFGGRSPRSPGEQLRAPGCAAGWPQGRRNRRVAGLRRDGPGSSGPVSHAFGRFGHPIVVRAAPRPSRRSCSTGWARRGPPQTHAARQKVRM